MIKIILLGLSILLCIFVIVSLIRFIISDFKEGSKGPFTYISIILVIEFVYLSYRLATLLFGG